MKVLNPDLDTEFNMLKYLDLFRWNLTRNISNVTENAIISFEGFSHWPGKKMIWMPWSRQCVRTLIVLFRDWRYVRHLEISIAQSQNIFLIEIPSRFYTSRWQCPIANKYMQWGRPRLTGCFVYKIFIASYSHCLVNSFIRTIDSLFYFSLSTVHMFVIFVQY